MGTIYWQLNDTLAGGLMVEPGLRRAMEGDALSGAQVLPAVTVAAIPPKTIRRSASRWSTTTMADVSVDLSISL